MSWISGEFVINDMSQRSMEEAKKTISSIVRHNADLEEFPHMGKNIMQIEHLRPRTIFDSEEEASSILEEMYSDWARRCNAIVTFRDTSQAKETKRLLNLQERLEKEKQKLQDYLKKSDCKNFKAKLITCPGCESKINKKYINGGECLLCRTDLRSKTVIETTKRYQANINNISSEINKELKKQKEKLPIKYLIGYCEYVG